MQAWVTGVFDALFDASSPRLRAWMGATRTGGYSPEEALRAQTVVRRAWDALDTHGRSIFLPLAQERTFSEQAIRLYSALARVRALQAPTLRALRKAAPTSWQRSSILSNVLGTDAALRAVLQTYADALTALADETRVTSGMIDISPPPPQSQFAWSNETYDALSNARHDLRGYARMAAESLEDDSTAGAGHPLNMAIHHAVARAHGEGPYSGRGTSTWRRLSVPAGFASEDHETDRARTFRALDKLIVGILAYGGRRTLSEATARMSEADARAFFDWSEKELAKFRFEHEKPAKRGAYRDQSALTFALANATIDPVYRLRLPFRVVVETTRYPTDLAAMRTVGANLLTPTDRADALTLIAATLARGREQARRYYPTLFADLPRVDWYFYNARGVKTPNGDYLRPTDGEPARVRMYLQQYAKKDARSDESGILKTLVHEGAHHIWRTKLNEREQAFWADLVTQRAPIDYNAILAALETPWPPPAPVGWSKLPVVAADGPTVYGARWGEHDLFPIWRSQVVRHARDGGGFLEYDEDVSEPLTRLAARMALRAGFYRAEGFDVSDAYVRDYAAGYGETRRKSVMFLRVRGTRHARFPTFDPARDRWQYPPPDASLAALLPTIKEANPKVYLQILIASSKYDPDYWKKESASAWAWLDTSKGDPKPLFHYTIPEIEALRDKQEALHVPVFPVTTYGATNPEEAFCDAVGLYVAYGPGAVLEPVREILFRLAPRVRRNPAPDSTSDT
jgi:hypothetical protein